MRLKLYEKFITKDPKKTFGYTKDEIEERFIDITDKFDVDIIVEFEILDTNNSKNINVGVRPKSEDNGRYGNDYWYENKKEIVSCLKEIFEDIEGYTYLTEHSVSGGSHRKTTYVYSLREDAWFKRSHGIELNKKITHLYSIKDFEDIFHNLIKFGYRTSVKKLFFVDKSTTFDDINMDNEGREWSDYPTKGINTKSYKVDIFKKYNFNMEYPDEIKRDRDIFLESCEEIEKNEVNFTKNIKIKEDGKTIFTITFIEK